MGMIIFYMIYYSILTSDQQNNFMFILFSYIFAGMFGFLTGYLLMKLFFIYLLKRQADNLWNYMKDKRRFKKLWIWLFTKIAEALFFIFSIQTVLAGEFFVDLNPIVAYVIVWFGIELVSAILGRLLYFVFYTF